MDKQPYHIQPEQVKIPKYLPDIPEVRNDFASYYEFMAMMDLEYKYVMDYLEKIGELDNTIIIYSSDHGGVQEEASDLPLSLA
ncbi:sulfatase-like hydrolase/transferase [Persicobacter diffluens]|uniref:Sulfatase N-terminal domain-containing protein n=1 Tax=Persicobacter diffluens TaxID=981 RepID=A0AAN4W5V2_9BACT|nr:hypothetical protein PEDI_56970 [Persicobacter diffluens]